MPKSTSRRLCDLATSLDSLGLPARAATPKPLSLEGPTLASLGLSAQRRTALPDVLAQKKLTRTPNTRVPASGGEELSGRRRAREESVSAYAVNLPERGVPFVRLEGVARMQAAAPCLRKALVLIQRRDGWCQGALADSDGRCSLQGALQVSGSALEGYYAREVLRRILHETDFTAWNDHPFRVRADVVRLLKTALRLSVAGVKRGGWVVSR